MTQSPRSQRHPVDDETVGAATRALADATAALTRLLGRQVTSATADVSETIASSLREAAKGLATASEAVERRTGGSRADEQRRAKVDKTRSDLLVGAERVFAARGYEGASVGDIAAQAGYTKGALYAHFGSKSELVLELARQRLQCDKPAARPTVDLAEELEAQVLATGDDTSTLLGLELLAYAVRHPESRAELAPLFASSMDGLARQVQDDGRRQRGESAGAGTEASTPTQDETDAALGVFAVTNVAAMLTAVSDRDATSRAAGRLVAKLLAVGADRLLAPEGRPTGAPVETVSDRSKVPSRSAAARHRPKLRAEGC